VGARELLAFTKRRVDDREALHRHLVPPWAKKDRCASRTSPSSLQRRALEASDAVSAP
jgi:hypothetical protein